MTHDYWLFCSYGFSWLGLVFFSARVVMDAEVKFLPRLSFFWLGVASTYGTYYWLERAIISYAGSQ